MCPQYLWIDTPHAYGRTTLKFRFLMGIFKFSDPMYRGSNIIVHQIQNFPQLLYIKLHLKMSGNINFFQFWVILGHLVPPPYIGPICKVSNTFSFFFLFFVTSILAICLTSPHPVQGTVHYCQSQGFCGKDVKYFHTLIKLE